MFHQTGVPEADWIQASPFLGNEDVDIEAVVHGGHQFRYVRSEIGGREQLRQGAGQVQLGGVGHYVRPLPSRLRQLIPGVRRKERRKEGRKEGRKR